MGRVKELWENLLEEQDSDMEEYMQYCLEEIEEKEERPNDHRG